MHHRHRQAHTIWWSTWAAPLRSCPLATAADWCRVPRLCPLTVVPAESKLEGPCWPSGRVESAEPRGGGRDCAARKAGCGAARARPASRAGHCRMRTPAGGNDTRRAAGPVSTQQLRQKVPDDRRVPIGLVPAPMRGTAMSESTTAGPPPAEPSAAAGAAPIRPFGVAIPDQALDDLRRRIAATRWPSRELVPDRSQGVQLATTQELARYWAEDYDFGRIEARLNALPQFTTEIDGVEIHFIHVRSKHEDALPLIMTHGWPGSVIELLETIGPLTDPTAHGGTPGDAFHLVLPSLPGYGFSREPPRVRCGS